MNSRIPILVAALAVAPTLPVLADGDPRRGLAEWNGRCASCHALRTDLTGPRHAGVFGRRAGTVPGFDYSPALKAAGHVWDADSLDRWLTDPERFVPGQRMFVKVTDPRARQDVIAYLKTLKP